MDREMVGQVRRFNRVVTQRVGALNDHFLGRDRPLGAARLLWEIGPDGRDVRTLRAQLGLDSGYLSRLLRSLEADGLISVESDEADKRVRVARATQAGIAERKALDERSDEVATTLLEPLSPGQRARLVAAMADVERLLLAGMVGIAEVDPADPDARYCMAAYAAELDARFEQGFDMARSLPADDVHLRRPEGLVLVARLGADPVGCVTMRFHGEACHVKRMWVAASARGLGLGRRLLAELESRAVEEGTRLLRLETNRALKEAIALYRSSGFREVAPFNDEPYAHHWFEKPL
jgi:DNA-binding MarR family transcriptional regulator/GNAT superfamily N-acetyltransferase